MEDIPIMRSLPNLKIINPADNNSAKLSVDLAYQSNQPVYIKLDKGFFKDLNFSRQELSKGFVKRNNKGVCIITTGSMIHEISEIKKYLEKNKIKVSTIYIYLIKPLNKKKIANLIKKNSTLITIEEQHVDGGIGSQICEIISDYNLKIPIKRYGIKDFYSKRYGDRNWLRKVYNLDVEFLKKNILSWLKKINK